MGVHTHTDPRVRRHLRHLDDLRHLDLLIDDHAAAVGWARDVADSSIEDREALETERDEAKEELESTRKDYALLEKEIEKLEKANDELEDDLRAARREIADLQDELESCKLDLFAQQRENTHLAERLERIEKGIS